MTPSLNASSPHIFQDSNSPHLWIHAASLGDVNAVSPLTQKLVQNSINSLDPRHSSIKYRISTSATTSSGRQQWRRKWPQLPCYLPPLGPPPHAWSLFQVHHPNLLILELLEIWPHWIHSWAKKNVYIGVVNGRISKKTYDLGKRWLRSSFKKLHFFLAQTELDAQRALDLGVAPQKIQVCGNSKYDQWTFTPPHIHSINTSLPPPLFDLIVANLQADEEDEFCRALEALISPIHQIDLPWRLCIVPRHLKRKRALQLKLNHLLQSKGWCVRLRSSLPSLVHKDRWSSIWNSQREVLLVDGYGELKSLYPYAKVTLMGGSFGARGGQSLIEAAQTGYPVLYGPHIPHIQIEHHLLQNQNGYCMNSWAHALEALPSFLTLPIQTPNLSSLNGALAKQLHYLSPILQSL